MASITQTIPSLNGGLSEQPDELKKPGQVIVADNVIPDITHGLLKRPGGRLVSSITNFSPSSLNSYENGKWFSYYRDETEQYIGQVSRNGDINMWICSDLYQANTTTSANFTRSGAVITVYKNSHGLNINDYVDIIFSGNTTATDNRYKINSIVDSNSFTITDSVSGTIGTTACTYGKRTVAAGSAITVNYTTSVASALTSYLTHTKDEDIQAITLNDYTFLTNRTKTVSMSSTVETVRPPEAFIDVKTIAYARQYALNIFDNTNTQTVNTATRIKVTRVKSSNNYCDTNGAMVARSSRQNQTTRCDDSAGDGRDAYSPNVGTRLFNISHGSSQTDEAISGNHTYTITVKNSSNATVNRGTKLYFRVRTIGQSVAYTEGSTAQNQDGTSGGQTTEYQTRYTTTYDLVFGGSGWETGDYFYFWMYDAYYKCTIEDISTTVVEANLGLIRPEPTPFSTETTLTAESILGNVRKEIIATGNFTSSNVKQIGNGLYITRPSGAFNISAPSSDLLNVMTSSVVSSAQLPTQCKHGYIVKVSNSEAVEDDYYVKFVGENGQDGAGVWEECNKPGRNIEFNAATMPIQMVREANGTFTVNQVSWVNCAVGSNDPPTNPEPSFVGFTINRLIFFRNRLVILSDENIIMSRPGNFFNFWSKTAQTHSVEDPIDLSCSSNYPAIVYDGIQINAGLLLFTKNQQFMLTTDSDILSPETAKINAVSSFNFNIKTNPVSLGTTVAFLDNANKFSRFFEMSNVLRQGEPDVIDQSKVISKSLSKDISLISESRENSVVFFSQKDTNIIYGFRYYAAGERRLMQSWFSWTVAGNIQYHCMLDDALYVIVRNNNNDQMVKYSLKLDDSGFFVTDTKDTTSASDDDVYRIHLDHSSFVTAGNNTYNDVTNITTIPKPTGYESSNQMVAYEPDLGNDLGRYAMITVNGNNLEIVGNWENNTFIIGYLFDMTVQIPTLFVTRQEGTKFRSDAKSSLIIHRLKFSFGSLGVYSTTLQRTGKPDYTETKELALAGVVSASRVPIVPEVIETVPCYERNTNLKIFVTSTHPAPATLISLAWEGDFTDRFYRRV